MNFKGSMGAVALWVCLAGTAHSADSGFYFGVNVGQADFDIGKDEFLAPDFPLIVATPGGTLTPPPPAFEPSPGAVVDFSSAVPALFFPPGGSDVEFHHVDTSLVATIGYRVNSYVAAELSYVDLGTVRKEATFPIFGFFPFAPVGTLRQSAEIETTGVQIALLGTWPVSSRWALFGKGGYFLADSSVDQWIRVAGSSSTGQFEGAKYSSENALLGAGVEYYFAQRWTARLEYQHHFAFGDDAFLNETEVDNVALGILFDF
jgi:opacity protein-like surface antigen